MISTRKYIKHKLTSDYLERIKSPTDLYVNDIEIPGYHLRYSALTGRKALYLQYALNIDGARISRNLKIGNYPELMGTEARAEAIKFRGQLINGIDPMIERRERLRQMMADSDKRILMKDIMEKYLAHSKSIKKPQTYSKEQQMARKHLIPMLGHIPINEVNVRHLEQMHQEIGETAKAVANQCLMLMSYFLKWCERQEYRTLNTNPVKLIRKFKLQGRDRVYSDEEYARIVEAFSIGRKTNILNPIGFDVLELIIFTGCRNSEIRKLTWDEVDFDNSLLRLKKGKTGARSVPLARRAVEIIKSALQNKTANDAPVFPSATGNTMTDSALYKHWDFVRMHAKLENARIHDLRHSFATVASMNGENAMVIQKVMGHSTIATTQRYVHINNVAGIEAADNTAKKIIRKIKHGAVDKAAIAIAV